MVQYLRHLVAASALVFLGFRAQAEDQPGKDTPKDRAEAEAILLKAKVSWERDSRRAGLPIDGIGFISQPATDKELAALSAFPDLERVGLYQAKITADGIASLKKIAK